MKTNLSLKMDMCNISHIITSIAFEPLFKDCGSIYLKKILILKHPEHAKVDSQSGKLED